VVAIFLKLSLAREELHAWTCHLYLQLAELLMNARDQESVHECIDSGLIAATEARQPSQQVRGREEAACVIGNQRSVGTQFETLPFQEKIKEQARAIVLNYLFLSIGLQHIRVARTE
jgi:hypothetical protein